MSALQSRQGSGKAPLHASGAGADESGHLGAPSLFVRTQGPNARTRLGESPRRSAPKARLARSSIRPARGLRRNAMNEDYYWPQAGPPPRRLSTAPRSCGASCWGLKSSEHLDPWESYVLGFPSRLNALLVWVHQPRIAVSWFILPALLVCSCVEPRGLSGTLQHY